MVYNPPCISIQINDALRVLDTKFLASFETNREGERGWTPFSRHKGKAGYLSASPGWSLLLKPFVSLFHWAIVELGKKLVPEFASSLIAPKQKWEFQTPCLPENKFSPQCL